MMNILTDDRCASLADTHIELMRRRREKVHARRLREGSLIGARDRAESGIIPLYPALKAAQ